MSNLYSVFSSSYVKCGLLFWEFKDKVFIMQINPINKSTTLHYGYLQPWLQLVAKMEMNDLLGFEPQKEWRNRIVFTLEVPSLWSTADIYKKCMKLCLTLVSNLSLRLSMAHFCPVFFFFFKYQDLHSSYCTKVAKSPVRCSRPRELSCVLDGQAIPLSTEQIPPILHIKLGKILIGRVRILPSADAAKVNMA